jgi:transposase
MPDERCRVLRRRLARREQLMRARTRAKNEIHAVLQRRLQGKPPCADLFGVKGRRWLAGLELPLEERESVDAGIRHVEFLDSEIVAERLIAQEALAWPEIRRLMAVPGVNLICAATFIAAVGDPRRFLTSRKLVAYLGLDPKVRQSGDAPARSGPGSASAARPLPAGRWSRRRGASCCSPGPCTPSMTARALVRGHGKAIVATARKLAILFWCMLCRGEDYAHQPPSLTKKKLRRLELTAGAPKHAKAARGTWSSNLAIRQAERELAAQAEASYRRLVKGQQAGAPARKVGASATPERA